jgi:hypothetical protein
MAYVKVSRELAGSEDWHSIEEWLRSCFTSWIDITMKGDRDHTFIADGPGIPLNVNIDVVVMSPGGVRPPDSVELPSYQGKFPAY